VHYILMLLCLLSMNMQAMQTKSPHLGYDAESGDHAPQVVTASEMRNCRTVAGGCCGLSIGYCVGIPWWAHGLPVWAGFGLIPCGTGAAGLAAAYVARHQCQECHEKVKKTWDEAGRSQAPSFQGMFIE
jgi:hypothetical protein